MKKNTIIIDGHEVEFTLCTAIAASIGDTVRQKAVFVHDTTDESGDGDSVYFVSDLPENEEDARALFQECGDTYEETLCTVIFED